MIAQDTNSGQEKALGALAERREKNKTRKRIDNSALHAGSPMYFDCDGCGGEISVPEDYTPPRKRLCQECGSLKEKGLLD